ncbi:MAG: arabinose isomerase [Clostridia bacterium]|nr:arabinose isomerase [Clostridia bacterium]
MIERIHFKKTVVGVLSVAHGVYWDQFPGLKEKMVGYHKDFLTILEKNGVEIVDAGIVDTNRGGSDAVELFRQGCVSLIFCNMITYATSSVFAPVLCADLAPIVLVALQPRSAMDYERANTFMQLENDNICSVPEFYGAAAKMDRKIADVVIGKLYGDEKAQTEIAEWCTIAGALNRLKGARIGLMGHVLEAMYDMHTDPTLIYNAFGVHVPLLEVDDLAKEYHKVTDEEIEEQKAIICREFEMPEPKNDPVTMKLTNTDLYEAARCSAALERFRLTHQLDGLAYFYSGLEGSENRKIASSLIVGNSLLIARGIPMCGEYDIKTCIAMMILDAIGIGGSFAELHPFDFDGDCILVGHDGPHHIQLANGKPVLRSLKKYHGKDGSGASVEFNLKTGDFTMLGINQDGKGAYRFIIGEGVSNAGPIPATGNTNTRASFLPDTVSFVKQWCMAGPTHHFALGTGRYASTLVKLGKVMGMETIWVGENCRV